ncbi:hypothetical protein AHAS_Ahas13G0141700 [Arachis hypogaea]
MPVSGAGFFSINIIFFVSHSGGAASKTLRKMPPLQSLQLRRLFLGCFRSYSLSFLSSSSLKSLHFLPQQPSSNLNPPRNPFDLPSFFAARNFSSNATQTEPKYLDPIAQSLSSELTKDPDSDPLSFSQRLQLSFSHITLTGNLVLQILNISPEASRATVLGFHRWLISNPKFDHTDETVSYLVDFLGRRKDFKATHYFLSAALEGSTLLGSKTLTSVQAGPPMRSNSSTGWKRTTD